MSGKSKTSGWSKWKLLGNNKCKRGKPRMIAGSGWKHWKEQQKKKVKRKTDDKLLQLVAERTATPQRRVRGKSRASDVATCSPPAAPHQRGSRLKIELKVASIKYVPPPGAPRIPPSWAATRSDSDDDDPFWDLRSEKPRDQGCQMKCPSESKSLPGLLLAMNSRFKGTL